MNTHLRKLLLIVGILCTTVVIAQTTTEALLLQRIVAWQQQGGAFVEGVFPAYRQYDKNIRSIKPDVNTFYNGLIGFTLHQYQAQLCPTSQAYIRTIDSLTANVASLFQNQKGRGTYNFWRTDTPQVFPNSGWLNWFDQINALPDDFDDTAIMLMALRADSVQAAKVHELMQRYTNGYNNKWIANTDKRYQKIKAYSTWFGNKMPVDFDVCVLSNVLYMVKHYNLPFTAADSASLQLIETVIANGDFIERPHYVAPHYATTPIILYHVSRLMEKVHSPVLAAHQPMLIALAQKLYATSDNLIEKVILSTTLHRLGAPLATAEVMVYRQNFWELLEQNDFVFFIANMASMAPNPWKLWIGNTGIGKFYYYCPAYNLTLLLENHLRYSAVSNRCK